MTWLQTLARLGRGCPPGWKLTRAISDGLEPRLEWHFARCQRCSTEYQILRALVVTVKSALPEPEAMARDVRDAMGSRLRMAALQPRARRVRRIPAWTLAGIVAPVAAVAIVLVGRIEYGAVSRVPPSVPPPAQSPAQSRASIRAIGQARFARARLLPDEIVRLDDGEIELEIAPLRADERFRVVTDDGEVEVRGTSFKVSVSQHHLAAVHVWRGRVEVRSRDGAFAVLDAGDDWIRDAQARVPQRVVAPPAPAPTAPTEAPAGVSAATAAATVPARHHPSHRDGAHAATAVSFGHAWSLLRQGDAQAAAAELEQVESQAHGRDIEEDALYWRAVAVGRTGDSAGALALFARFLDRFPASSRAGEASAAFGWLLLERGDTGGARRAFERAARDPAPQVRTNAQDGLRRTQANDP